MDAATLTSTIINLRARAKKAAKAGNAARAKELEDEVAIYEKQLKKPANEPTP